jgi:hypothetical protein
MFNVSAFPRPQWLRERTSVSRYGTFPFFLTFGLTAPTNEPLNWTFEIWYLDGTETYLPILREILLVR